VVVVDAFRASATISVLVSRGARVVPVDSLEAAARLEANLRAGERGSAKVRGFDLGNSPTEVAAADIAPGSTVALSTTNGTRIIRAARGAREVLVGSFVNAGSVAAELLSGGYGCEVWVIGCGWQGRRSSEDERAAGAILHRLSRRGAEMDERAARVTDSYLTRDRQDLYRNSAARRLKRLGYERDLDFCLAEDTVPVVPRLVDGYFVAAATL
jgi:2-phosphosulfolactate phosphatase